MKQVRRDYMSPYKAPQSVFHTLAGAFDLQNKIERAPAVINPAQPTINKSIDKKVTPTTPSATTETLSLVVSITTEGNPSLGSGTEGKIYHIEVESAKYGILTFVPSSLASPSNIWRNQAGSTNLVDICDSISNHSGDDSYYADFTYEGGSVFGGYLSGLLQTSLGRQSFDYPMDQLTLKIRAQKVLGGLFDYMQIDADGIEFNLSNGDVKVWDYPGVIDIPGSIVTYTFVSPNPPES